VVEPLLCPLAFGIVGFRGLSGALEPGNCVRELCLVGSIVVSVSDVETTAGREWVACVALVGKFQRFVGEVSCLETIRRREIGFGQELNNWQKSSLNLDRQQGIAG